jgi:hypothetical protein
MSDIPRNPSREEIAEHTRSYFTFAHLILYAVLHIALTLACVALAFIGHAALVAFIFWVGGTLVLLSAFALAGNNKQSL